MPEENQEGDLNLVALRDFATRVQEDQQIDARWKNAVRAMLAHGEIPANVSLLAQLVEEVSDAST